MSNIALEVKDLVKSFAVDGATIFAVDHVSFQVKSGEFVALVGPSGSGKTTMLSILAALLAPTSGQVLIDGQDLAQMNEKRRVKLRREKIGFTFQSNNLIPFLTAQENVALVLTLNGVTKREAMSRARHLLEAMDLGHRAETHPATLSGGEQQRVAVARAVANSPAVILADEPTGALDTERGKAVMALLRRLGREQQAAVIVVTHDERMLEGFDRVYHMTDGRLA
jgi:putative ABC transport system ATP-binding protein